MYFKQERQVDGHKDIYSLKSMPRRTILLHFGTWASQGDCVIEEQQPRAVELNPNQS